MNLDQADGVGVGRGEVTHGGIWVSSLMGRFNLVREVKADFLEEITLH
jgi:hypothetical protein